EAGYSLNVAGGKMAYRFDLATGDSLRAIRCYFDPIFEDPSDGSFLITIWTSLTPEVIQHQNFSFSSPEYRIDGLNKFVEYPLDSTIWVEGTIYVGWVQTTADKLNLGFDKNRNNQDKIFYKVSGGFLNTSFEGSLMLRPVFVSDTDPFTGIPEQAGPGRLQLYPNPASDRFQVRADGVEGAERLRILDALGREAGSWSYREGAPIDLGSAPSGTYIVQLLGRAGAVLATGRIIVQR
ncbi:MAG: T9SS type A sorting domain-containing protein, partial [Flavobacteriales bacterium]|nr:T9SS type A sorting domain-containing protein [Flavobacteriales bacterium]